MDAGNVRISFEARDSTCLVHVSGELTLVTEREFTARAAEAMAAYPGPMLFDLSGLSFLDRHGARALARTLAAASPRPTGLHGCSPAMWQVLTALGFDLAQPPGPARVIAAGRPAREVAAGGPAAEDGPRSRGQILTAQVRVAEASARQSAADAGELMARLAATYAELALNGRYRARSKSKDRGRLLALSGRARALSQRYLRHATSDAGH